MRIRLLSDLHLEVEPWQALAAQQDVVVLAGDIHNADAGIEWAARQFDCPVLYVPGNHEFYGTQMQRQRDAWATLPATQQVRVLDNARAEIAGVRFLGTTLWTDFELYGDRRQAFEAASRYMADYALIRYGERFLTAPDTAQLHAENIEWLEAALAQPWGGRTVVVTHHCPHPGSIAPEFAQAATNPAFVSDLSKLIDRHRIDLWLHGHTHASRDYTVGRTRIVCNPRGYARGATQENPAFQPGLVIAL